MTILTVTHRTVYRYAVPVGFGEHRMMFRPRDSHELRLLDTSIATSPPAQMRWLFDVFGNSVGIASFDETAAELSFESVIRVVHYPTTSQALVIEPFAARYPFSYSAEEMPDLGRTAERHYPDPDHKIALWARDFIEGEGGTSDTLNLLSRMAHAIHENFSYARREESGTQTPIETVALRSGSCRDFALLMMEAARSLGFAARFVSGYLYDAAMIRGDRPSSVGSGETHAWLQIYLPGAGWVEFDPTNGIIGGANLIRVAVSRDPAQAAPLRGSFVGRPTDFLGMTATVAVTAEPDETDDPAVEATADTVQKEL